jgi:DHA2 family multidrug resistance protein
MSTAADRPAQNHRALFVAILVASYMQAVTISLPNASLLYIQGSLSMADDEVGWIFTSYITASVVTMTMARWLAARYGRKIIYLLSIGGFALGLMLATRAATPMQFIAARIVQGLASGIIGPVSAAILLDLAPPAAQAQVNRVAGATLMLGILSGPALGGWLGDYCGWASLFYVNLPVAGFVFVVVACRLPEKRAGQTTRFDFFGLATFLLAIIGLQMLVDRGERLEWFSSAEIWAEAAAAVLGCYLYLVHVLTTKTHFLDKALFKDRNFVLAAILYFVFGFVLLPTIALTSPMLDELLQYPADTTGYMSIPRGMALLAALIMTGRAPARIDNRILIACGMALVIYANWRMLGYSPQMDWRPVVIAGVLQGAGLGILVPTLTKAAFATLAPAVRPEATALFNLSRLYGSTIGIALVQTLFYDNTQAMHIALAKDITPYSAVTSMAGSIAQHGLASLNAMITDQAAFVGIIDQFKVMMVAMLIVSPLVIFLPKPRAAHQQGTGK